MTLKLGSLFSGYGGLDMAVHAAFGDVETVWVSDIEPGPCKVLEFRYPNVPNLGDVTKIDWSTVEPVDIISGGSPCQDLSMAGRRAGMRPGTRSGLWENMREAIAIIKPTFVVWENVRGALSAGANSESQMEHDQGPVGGNERDGRTGKPVLRALGRLLGDLTDLGYDTQWTTLRASDVGACHQRARVFLLAVRSDATDADRVRAGGGAVAGSGVPGEEPDAKAYGADSRSSGRLVTLPTTTTRDYKDHEIGIAKHRPHDRDTLSRALVVTLPTPMATDGNGARNATAGRSPGSHHNSGTTLGDAAFADMWGAYAPAIERWEHAIGQPAPSPSEPSPTSARPRLSAKFTEWMMGLPDGWITDVPGITRTEAIRACGNGVVPQQGATALAWLIDQANEYKKENAA